MIQLYHKWNGCILLETPLANEWNWYNMDNDNVAWKSLYDSITFDMTLLINEIRLAPLKLWIVGTMESSAKLSKIKCHSSKLQLGLRRNLFPTINDILEHAHIAMDSKSCNFEFYE